MLEAQILILAKEPLAGRVKTRLSPPLTMEQAAAVAAAALQDTVDVVSQLPVRRRRVVLDGAAGAWLPAGYDVLPQRGDGLDARLAAAYDDAFSTCPLPALLIGMDTPQLTAGHLTDAVTRLLDGRPVLGYAEDGGWWALGLHAPDPDAFLGVPMSTPWTGACQEQRLRARGLEPVALPRLRDVDRIEDLLAVAAAMPPTSHLARTVATFAGQAVV